jgi:hypothetical protein
MNCSRAKFGGGDSKVELHDAYIERRKAELDELDAQLKTFEFRAQDIPLEDQTEFYGDLPALRDQFAMVRMKLGKLGESSDNKWDELERDLTASWEELQSGMEHAHGSLK